VRYGSARWRIERVEVAWSSSRAGCGSMIASRIPLFVTLCTIWDNAMPSFARYGVGERVCQQNAGQPTRAELSHASLISMSITYLFKIPYPLETCLPFCRAGSPIISFGQ
jgi:hypothetical protein